MKALAFFDVTSSIFFSYVKLMKKFSKATKGSFNYHHEVIMYYHEDRVIIGTDGRAMAIYHLPKDNIFSDIKQDCLMKIEGKVLIAYEGKVVNYKRAYPTNTKQIELQMFDEDKGVRTETEFCVDMNRNIVGLFRLIRSLPLCVNLEYLERMKGYTFTVNHTLDNTNRPILFKEVATDAVKDSCGWLEVVVMPIANEVYHDFKEQTHDR